jgi:ParB family transcriptional regulator, chromosome partitioning protein
MKLPNTLKTAEIDASDRLRQIDKDWAAAIAGSMAGRTVDTPITVRMREGVPTLVAGAHRLYGFGLNGWDELQEGVHFTWVEMNDGEARLAEIDENLMRRELSAVDRAIFLAERKKVWEELYPETKQGGDGKYKEKLRNSKRPSCPFGPATVFTKDVAAKTGLSDRTIRRSVELVKILSTDVISLLRATPVADNAAQLKALARETPEAQLAVAKLIAEGAAKNVAQARQLAGLVAPSEVDPHTAMANKLLALWNRASPKARKIFEAAIGAADDESVAA